MADNVEVTDAERIKLAGERREVMVFLRNNPTFTRNARNAQTMRVELDKRNLAWTSDNLQAIWDEIDRGMFDLTVDIGRPEAMRIPEPVAVEEPVAKPAFPWGEALTKERVKKMRIKEFKKYLTDRRYGKEFTTQVNALGLRSSDLGSEYSEVDV